MPQSEAREERLSLRISPAQKRMLNKAARTRQMTTTQFVLQATMEAARETLAEQTVIYLTPEQWDEFNRRLDEPARVIPALQQLHEEMQAIREKGA